MCIQNNNNYSQQTVLNSPLTSQLTCMWNGKNPLSQVVSIVFRFAFIFTRTQYSFTVCVCHCARFFTFSTHCYKRKLFLNKNTVKDDNVNSNSDDIENEEEEWASCWKKNHSSNSVLSFKSRSSKRWTTWGVEQFLETEKRLKRLKTTDSSAMFGGSIECQNV